MRVRTMFLALALIGAAPAARAQASPCAPEDLRCRVDRIEAKLAAMEAKQDRIETVQKQAPPPAPPPPFEVVHTGEICNPNCAVTAEKLCKDHGFATGVAKSWVRPKQGPLMLYSATCRR